MNTDDEQPERTLSADDIVQQENDITEQELEEEEEESDDDDAPMLFVDVNLGPDKQEWIIVYENDTAESLAAEFSERHKLTGTMQQKLVLLLQKEISGLLERIVEEEDTE